MTYKGYSARAEYSAEDGVFFGRLLGINDLVNFESANAEGLEEEFHKAVDDYLPALHPHKSCLSLTLLSFRQVHQPSENTRKIAECGAAVLTAAPCFCKIRRKCDELLCRKSENHASREHR